MPQLAPLADLSSFLALDPTQRLALAAPLAESLGTEFRALTALAGAGGMLAVEHIPSGVQLIAVPGGAFDMGLTEADKAEIRQCVDYDSGAIQSTLQRFEQTCSPVHRVAVSPFLLSVAHLKPDQVAKVSTGLPRSDILEPHTAAAFMKQANVFRLPSEAELEWVGREGGAVAFLNDGGRVWSKTHQWPNANAWGFAVLSFAAWTADQWHDNYEGAPAAAVPWTDGGPPSVYRGTLMEAPNTEVELLFGLSASRGRMVDQEEDEWPVGLRIARSISV
ncbi:MAG TPA: hypothetical protein VGL81_16615 [Polyangiaceae bacterium]|jgi:formylglycine-generating enzyme required for sulfatase activity